MLTDSDIKKFQKIYREEFGRDISKEDAIEKGTRLIRLIEAVFKPEDKNSQRSAEHHLLEDKNYEINKSKI